MKTYTHIEKMDFRDTDQFPHHHVLPSEYTETLGCIHHLMPYPQFESNPWEDLQALQSWLQAQPESMATWHFREVDVGPENWQTDRSRTYAHILGAWEMDRNGNNPRYVNPYYTHLDAVDWTPIQDRYEHIRDVGRFGTFTLPELADRFGVEKKNLWRYLQLRDCDWSEYRDDARRKMGNTIACTTEWTELSMAECARRLEMPPRTIQRWVNDYADVEVPPDPRSHDRAKDW